MAPAGPATAMTANQRRNAKKRASKQTKKQALRETTVVASTAELASAPDQQIEALASAFSATSIGQEDETQSAPWQPEQVAADEDEWTVQVTHRGKKAEKGNRPPPEFSNAHRPAAQTSKRAPRWPKKSSMKARTDEQEETTTSQNAVSRPDNNEGEIYWNDVQEFTPEPEQGSPPTSNWSAEWSEPSSFTSAEASTPLSEDKTAPLSSDAPSISSSFSWEEGDDATREQEAMKAYLLEDCILVGLDFEAWQDMGNGNAEHISEIGISTLDTRHIPVYAKNPLNVAKIIRNVQSRHLQIKEMARCNPWMRKKMCQEVKLGCRDHFHFGRPEKLSLGQALTELKKVLGLVGVQKGAAARKIVLVGHAIQHEDSFCLSNDIDITQIRDRIDTRVAGGKYISQPNGQGGNLAAVLHSVGLGGSHFHNAGNDAAFTLIAAICLAGGMGGGLDRPFGRLSKPSDSISGIGPKYDAVMLLVPKDRMSFQGPS